MGNAVSYFDDFGENTDFMNGNNNSDRSSSGSSSDNNDNSESNFSFLNKLNKFSNNNSYHQNNNDNNNRQSFINITEEELEVRRKQREVEKSKTTEQKREELKRNNSAVLIQKHWKGFSQRKKYSLFLTKIQVFKELLVTEKDYIQYLDVIIRIYSTPLKNLALQALQNKKESLGSSSSGLGKSSGNVNNENNEGGSQPPIHGLNLDEVPLTLDEVKIVFSQIEVILLYNSQLFEKLRSRLLSNFINKYGDSQNPDTPSKNTINNINNALGTPKTTSITTSPNSKNTIGANRTSTSTPTTPKSTNKTTPNTTPNSKNTATLLNSVSGSEKNPIGFYQEVGDIFLEMIDFLKVPYSHYIINFPMALKVLENASKRPAFMLFSQQCKSLPEVGRRDLQSFVSMPIQRIPRYVLLLRELLKFTVPGHSDHTNIELAVKRMEAIANLINRQMKEDETSKEVFQISQKLKPPIPNLVEPHRKIIKEGVVKIYKVDGNSHDNEISTGTIRPTSILSIAKGGTKYIFLFNDLFVITKKKKTHYQVEKVLSLEHSTIIDNYKMIKSLQQEKEKQQIKQKSSKDSDDDLSDSGSSSINVSSPNRSQSNSTTSSTSSSSSTNYTSFSNLNLPTSPSSSSSSSTPEKKGERYYFKLHTLETSIVICLSSESEKDDWKNNFISIINRITENSLSFNPKWTKNDLIYGEKQRQRSLSTSALKRGSLSPDNFTLTKSIAELLALSQPIKGMDKNSKPSPDIKNNNVNNTTTTTTTTTEITKTNSNTENNINNENQNSKDTNGGDGTTNNTRSRSSSISVTFERLLQVIKS